MWGYNHLVKEKERANEVDEWLLAGERLRTADPSRFALLLYLAQQYVAAYSGDRIDLVPVGGAAMRLDDSVDCC